MLIIPTGPDISRSPTAPRISSLRGKVPVGGGAPVTIQSMCNTPTHDVEATVEQIRRLAAADPDIVNGLIPALLKQPGNRLRHRRGEYPQHIILKRSWTPSI